LRCPIETPLVAAADVIGRTGGSTAALTDDICPPPVANGLVFSNVGLCLLVIARQKFSCNCCPKFCSQDITGCPSWSLGITGCVGGGGGDGVEMSDKVPRTLCVVLGETVRRLDVMGVFTQSAPLDEEDEDATMVLFGRAATGPLLVDDASFTFSRMLTSSE